MSWYAVEAIDEAIKDTKELLLPFNRGTWLRLALIVIFTGGGVGFVNPVSFIPPVGDSDYSINDSSTDYSSTATIENQSQNAVTGLTTASSSVSSTLWILIGLSLIGIITLFFYLGSVFEFIYYQSLLDKDVSIRENFRKHWLKGLQYFIFEAVYILVVISLIIALFLGFVADPFVGLFGLLLGIPAFILLAVFAGLVHDFVLLQMIDTEENIVNSWRSLWPDLKGQWKEVIVYLVVKFGISIAISIAVTTFAVALLIPFIIFFGILTVLASLAAEILVLIPLLVGVLLFGILMLGISVATQTFVYFFVIEFYHSLTS